MKKKTVDQLCIKLLLDGNDEALERLANNVKRQYDVVLGNLCPHCGSKNVQVYDEWGSCDDCEESYDLPLHQIYDNEGNVVD